MDGMKKRAWVMLALCIFAGSALSRGPWRASESNTRGWELMSPQERIEHQARIRGFATLAECEAYQSEHRREMEARAAQLGKQLQGGGRDFCEHLRPAPAARQPPT